MTEEQIRFNERCRCINELREKAEWWHEIARTVPCEVRENTRIAEGFAMAADSLSPFVVVNDQPVKMPVSQGVRG